jgi:competence protein ComEC
MRLTQTLRLGFERTGSFHLFVVSGMHVALLAWLVFWAARRMRAGDGVATLLTLALTTAYAMLTGFGVPVERALLMIAVFLLARLLSRERNVLNALGAAALAVLVWSPRALFEASFQMTFLAIVAIAGMAIPLGERSFLPYARAARHLRDRWRDAAMPPHLAQLRVMLRLWGEALGGAFGRRAYLLPSVLLRAVLWAAQLGLIGVVAEAVMALPMAIYFHRATVFALPANMLSLPLVGVLAPLGILTFLASLVSSWFAAIPGAALALLLHAITRAVQHLSHAQAADIRVPGPTLSHALAALPVLAFCCWAVRRSRLLAIAAIAALPLVPLAALWPSASIVHTGQLEVTAIDVGQGDSLLVAGPTGRTMLIDAGGPTGAAANAENASGNSAFDIGEEVVSPYLWSRQMRRIDVLVLTHAHSDHMGGMPAVLRNFRPRELWVAVDPESERYRELLALAASLGVRVRHLRAGDHIDWDSVGIDVLAPARGYANPGPPVNDDSLVLRLQFGKASALLEGDAQAASEVAMVERARTGGTSANIGPDTLLKVGHHGSRTSTTPEFLALAAPEDAVISVGANNTFGHPRAEVLNRLAAAHAQVYRTDRDGATTFLLSPDGRIAAATFASNP